MSEYITKRETWTIAAETKESIVKLLENFLDAYFSFSKSHSYLYDKQKGRRELVSALAVYYLHAAPYFNEVLENNMTGYDKEDYKDLIRNSSRLSDWDLLEMSMLLHKWYTQEGYFRMDDTKVIYDSPVSEALAELFDNAKNTYMSHSYDSIKPLLQFFTGLYTKDKKGLKFSENDMTFLTTGDTGTGKSYFSMLIFEHWYKAVLQVSDYSQDYIEYFPYTDKQWIDAVSAVKEKPNYMVTHDEAINILYSKDAMSTKNKEVNKLFAKIRYNRSVNNLVVPSFLKIDKEFVRDSCNFLIYLERIGEFVYARLYSTDRMKRLLTEARQMIESSGKKSQVFDFLRLKTKPNFTCKVPLYNGILVEAYKEQKIKGVNESIDSAQEKMGFNKNKTLELGEKLYDMVVNQTYTKMDAYNAVGVHNVTGLKALRHYCHVNKLNTP